MSRVRQKVKCKCGVEREVIVEETREYRGECHGVPAYEPCAEIVGGEEVCPACGSDEFEWGDIVEDMDDDSDARYEEEQDMKRLLEEDEKRQAEQPEEKSEDEYPYDLSDRLFDSHRERSR